MQTLAEALQAKDARVRSSVVSLIDNVVNPRVVYWSCWGGCPRPKTPRPVIGRSALPLLLKALKKDESEEVRCSVAICLGRTYVDAKEIIPALLDALEDKAPAGRKAAAEASKRILVEAAAKAGLKEFEEAQKEYRGKPWPN